MKLVTLQPFRDFEGLEGRDRQRAFDRAERKFDLMAELGTDLLMCCSSVHPNAKPGIARAAEDYAELGDRAAKRGLRVAFEALAWGTHIHDYRDSWEVVRRADHASVGLVLDTFHIFSRQTELDTLASIPGDRIFWCKPPMPHGFPWIIFPGAATTAASRGRVNCRCSSLWKC